MYKFRYPPQRAPIDAQVLHTGGPNECINGLQLVSWAVLVDFFYSMDYQKKLYVLWIGLFSESYNFKRRFAVLWNKFYAGKMLDISVEINSRDALQCI